METSEDHILNGRVILNQPVVGYRAAIDPVLLAAAVPAKSADRALDLGCGVGAAMLCLAARVEGVVIDGLERQAELVDVAHKNVTSNGFQDRLNVYEGDILCPPKVLKSGRYDHVFANPPYITIDRGHVPPNASKCVAHVEGAADLKDWVQAALKYCRRKGTVCFIYRADRLADVLTALGGKAGEITVIPLWPKKGENAGRILIRARKDIKTPLVMTNGLVLHTSDGGYTSVAQRVLRGDLGL